jgi:predicted aldo/keto reductase-like oxidoreductase
MEVSAVKDGEISISGNIKTITDYQDIKRVVKEQMEKGINNIDVKIVESFSITSSVVGFFLKVINKDKVQLNLYVKDDRLFKILNDLNLVELFNVKKL